LFSLALALLAGEALARLMTCTTPLGTQCIGGFTGIPMMELLPHRPSQEQLKEAWDHFSEAPFLAHDMDLGWVPIDADPNNHVNKQSLHAARDRIYEERIPQDKSRIVAVGDSVIWATIVDFEDTWPVVLEEQRPDIEAMNFGVPGYGPTQALLRWRRDAKKFDADISVFGIWPDNLFRLLSINRYYLTFGELPRDKPRSVLENDQVRIVNSPIRSREKMAQEMSSELLPDPNLDFWIRQNHLEFKWWYHIRVLRVVASVADRWQRKNIYAELYSGENNLANEIAVSLSKTFAKEASEAGSIPVIVVLPAPDLIFRWRGKNSMPLTRQLREAGLHVLDLMPVFAAEADRLDGGQDPLFKHAHFSELGNKIFARELIQLSDELLGIR
jgi:hypothetical protein